MRIHLTPGLVEILKAQGHDVKDEARDSGGRWTRGVSGQLHSMRTSHGMYHVTQYDPDEDKWNAVHQDSSGKLHIIKSGVSQEAAKKAAEDHADRR